MCNPAEEIRTIINRLLTIKSFNGLGIRHLTLRTLVLTLLVSMTSYFTQCFISVSPIQCLWYIFHWSFCKWGKNLRCYDILFTQYKTVTTIWRGNWLDRRKQFFTCTSHASIDLELKKYTSIVIKFR